MKKIFSFYISVLLVCIFAFNNAVAQNVGVTGADPVTNAGSPFLNLSTAFSSINASAQTGNVIAITIIGNTTEPVGGAVLNQSSGLWTSISIQPSGGVARTITGAATAGLPLIDFNGADNVTIDGLNTGGNSLTISNTTVSATSITSTIRFIGGATNNTITNCSVQGSGTMSVAANGAVIFFSTDANTANGNDNNTISNNDIGPAGANLPTKGILGNGSTTTTAIGNSGIIITNNDIHDYFGAAVTSSGIAINGGCNNWTITNNRFYQTGIRTWTTGAVHRAIDLNSSAALSGVQGMTVTGNIIGYAANTQTGTYTMTGSTGKFQGIFFNGITLGTVSNINSNTIASVSLTGVTSSGTGATATPFSGIIINNGLVNSNSNIIGSQSATGSLTFSTTTTVASDLYGIYNFSLDNWTANGNNIGGISITNLGASGTFIFYGLRANTGTSVTFSGTSNNIGGTIANSIQLTSTGASSQVIGMLTSNAISTWTSNTIRNLTNNNGTGTSTAASVIGMSLTSTSVNHTLSQNTIFSLSNTHVSAATTICGIQYTAGSGSNLIERNLIHSFSIASTNVSAAVIGINVSGGTSTYQNNMIDLGIDASGISVPSGLISGINEIVGTNNFYFNSVYIGGSGIGGTSNSFAFQSGVTVNVRNYRDNIFYNARSNGAGTGKHYAVRVGGTTPNPTGLTINNNVYLANGTGAVFGFFNGADVASLAAWKTAVGQDANSFNSDPQFLLPAGTAATVNLHINPSIATVIEANGFNIGSITNDYDGQTRASLTPVDIGADAGNFTGIDLTGPVITYTPLGNTSSLSNRNLTANITDAGGVDGGTNVPRIYYKKSTDAGWVFDNAPGISGSDYTWTIDYTLVGGGSVSAGETIQYYVAAQDVFGNLSTSPSGGSGINPPGTTPPGSPNSYTIVNPPLAGDYTVGITLFNRITGKNITFERVVNKVMKEVYEPENDFGKNNKNSNTQVDPTSLLYNSDGRKVMKEVEEISFVPMENGKVYTGPLYVKRSENSNLPDEAMAGIYATITAAVADLNLRGSSAAVRFLLLDPAYNAGTGETFPIIINYSTASAVNTFTIQPASAVTTVVSGSSASGILVSASPYVIFQGDNNGGSVNRDMTINNTNSAVNTYVVGLFNFGGTSVADHNTIQNCNVIGGSGGPANAIFGIILNAAGGNFDNVVIDNNVITQTRTGIQFAGVSGSVTDDGQITNNTIGSTTDASSVFGQGILLSFANNTTIENNEIMGEVTGNTVFQTGNPTANISGISIINSCTNTKIRKNKIHDWYFNSTTAGYGAFAIAYGPGVTTNTGTTEISNNVIYNIKGDGDQETTSPANMGYLPQGICIYNNGTAPVHIYYNSIYMSGATLGASFNGSSACIGIANTVGAGSIDIRNNALQNSMTTATTGVGETMAIWVAGTGSLNTIFSNINYNDYFVNGQFPQIGYFNTFDVNLAAWKTATGLDSYSYSGNPGFTSTSNLLPDVSSTNCWIPNGNGIALASISTDINGNARSTTIAGGGTDIGAHEFTPSVAPPVISVIPSVSPLAVSNFILGEETVASIDVTTLGSLTGVDLQYYSGTVPPGLPGSPPVTDGYGNVYWDIQPVGSGFTYDLVIHYSPALLGTTVESSIQVAIEDPPNNGQGFYTPYPQGTGIAESDVDLVNHNIKVRGLTQMGRFIITDASAPLPVELASFTSLISGNNVSLNWSTVSEKNNSGFDIERSSVNGIWTKVGNVAGNGTTTTGHSYSFTERNLASGNYSYRLKQIDFNGNFEYFNLSNEVIIGVPTNFELSQNYPNPFNPSTKISFGLPNDGKVSLKIYDMTGKEVMTLVNEVKTAGFYSVSFNASSLSSGIYFYTLSADNFTATKKMMLIK
ncbi:MAG: T9SS type A sorting domain-containing protein [Bacteroidetes bacterium]|nr:T9SS type A sorting domain-containing protein [Bacteroidota bacterium]